MDEALGMRTSLRNTAPTAAERIEQDSIFDRDSDDDLTGQHPEWCVDLGTELRAMNKFELWLALGTGDVAATARVWRVGRECWQPACDIPDLACALKLHAQVLMATVRAAESEAEDRVTLVPGELPSMPVESVAAPSPEPSSLACVVAQSDDVCERIEHEQSDVSAIQCNQESIEAVMHYYPSVPVEVEAKSVTPGPATVDAPDAPITEPVIRPRRGLRRKKEASPWSGIAAITALVATTVFTLPSALATNAPNAAAHLPIFALPSPSAAADAVPPATNEPSRPAPVLAVAMAERPAEGAEPATKHPEKREKDEAHPSKHRVRPTSVSPSHRGQGRSRQHSR